jgi:hypothetical protein
LSRIKTGIEKGGVAMISLASKQHINEEETMEPPPFQPINTSLVPNESSRKALPISQVIGAECSVTEDYFLLPYFSFSSC